MKQIKNIYQQIYDFDPFCATLQTPYRALFLCPGIYSRKALGRWERSRPWGLYKEGMPLTEQDVLIDIRERLARVETKIDHQNGIREKVDAVEDKVIETEQRSKSNTHRIDKLEDNNRWLWRTVAGIVIAAVMAMAMRGGT